MACDKVAELKSVDYEILHKMEERGLKLTRQGALTVSQQTLSEWFDKCVRTLQYSLDRLVAAGIIGRVSNYRRVNGRNYRCANSYYLIKKNPFNFMAWTAAIAKRKLREPLARPVYANPCLANTAKDLKIFKNKEWIPEIDCGQGNLKRLMGLLDR